MSTEAQAGIVVGGREVRITNPDRVLWPQTGTTKRELLDYALAVAPVLLPYLRRRPTMLWRFPEGVDGPGWFQANCRGRPDWMPTHEVMGRRGETLRYCVIEEPAALAWLANLGTIELHPFGWILDAPEQPTALVLDLDPGPPAGLAECARVALLLRSLLGRLGLPSRVKTSGGLGLHVLVPLAPDQRFEHAKAVGRALGQVVAQRAPDLAIARIGRAERAGRVYVDWVQNDANRQLVAPYSPRATPVPQVSTPVRWAEVEAAAGSRKGATLRFGLADVRARLDAMGDLWALERPEPARLPDPAEVAELGGGSPSQGPG